MFRDEGLPVVRSPTREQHLHDVEEVPAIFLQPIDSIAERRRRPLHDLSEERFQLQDKRGFRRTGSDRTWSVAAPPIVPVPRVSSDPATRCEGHKQTVKRGGNHPSPSAFWSGLRPPPDLQPLPPCGVAHPARMAESTAEAEVGAEVGASRPSRENSSC